MDIIKNLICLDNNKACVIRLKADNMAFIKKDGEIDFDITVDFWDWWKRVISYIEGEPVDICFIYDKDYDLLKEDSIVQTNIINSEESAWKIEHIKSYFRKLRPTYFNLLMIGPEQQEYALDKNQGIKSRRFYTNLNFKSLNVPCVQDDNKSLEEATESSISEDDITEFAKYFIDLIRSERG